ncbi:DUF2975 domain-containing protein [Thalassococcus sp. CAU 1522]|uniref:DUF2975 domain-containing protein n=1 Tax=Thalassococcus arenae TaxID=2851652 RepID=A0ABS6N5D0_9RHOB|nr:DUF2975 domain-containing protein [Thalassococcus arenae]MBV2358993.1 DUF2975 domain-containing protein [Thalassococcus arenae]
MTHLPHRTRRIAHALFLSVTILMAAIVGLLIYVTAVPTLLVAERAHSFGLEVAWPVSGTARAALVACAWMSAGIALFTLSQVARLFRAYADDAALTPNAARAIRGIGLGLVAQAFWSLLLHPLSGLALTMDAPVGQRMLAIAIQSDAIGTALAGGLMLLIGIVMTQAVAVARENEGFV